MIMVHACNSDGTKAAKLPTGEATGPSGLIIFRSIKTIVPWKRVHKKIRNRRKKKLKRKKPVVNSQSAAADGAKDRVEVSTGPNTKKRRIHGPVAAISASTSAKEAASNASSSGNNAGSSASAGNAIDIDRWLESRRLDPKYKVSLIKLGVQCVEDFAEVTNDDLKQMGMKTLEIRRFHK